MNSIEIYESISYKDTSSICKYKSSTSHNNHVDKNVDKSDISYDAIIGYKFLNRIKSSAKDINKGHFLEEYKSEYEKIKKEIDSKSYGDNTKKYMNLLNDAFKSLLEHTSNLLIKNSSKTHNIKMSTSCLIKCQKQYDTANTLVWIFKAERKRISREIEDYRKKKNHQMVTSLTQLSNTYKHVINNISNTITLIKTSIDDSLSDNSSDTADLDKLIDLEYPKSD